MKMSIEKKRIAKLNQSRKELGSKGSTTKVSSGNVKFDSEMKEIYREMIASICKQKGYNSVEDMIENVRKRRPHEPDPKEGCTDSDIESSPRLTNNLERESIHRTLLPISQASQNSHPVQGMGNYATTKAIETPSLALRKNSNILNPYKTSNSSATLKVGTPSPKVLNPYKKSTNVSTTTPVSSTLPTSSSGCQYKVGIINPYNKSSVLSTPASKKPTPPPSRIVTNSKSPSTAKLSGSTSGDSKFNTNINMIAMTASQKKSASVQISLQSTVAHRTKSAEKWTCSICTFVNESRAWSRTKPKCAMCDNFRR